MNGLFRGDLVVINVGLRSFYETLKTRDVKVVQVDWRPPLAVDRAVQEVIAAARAEIGAANEEAVRRITRGRQFLVGMGRALDVIPGMKRNLLLHAGPPVLWKDMCGPMKGAVTGALIYEGLAPDAEGAQRTAASGEIEFAPCHEHSAVGPMAGIVSASMPVFVIENEGYGNRAYATMNEGLGKVLRYGAYGEDVITRLKWMEKVLYPSLRSALEKTGRIDLTAIIAQALQMGDEVHNRNRAATSILYRALAPAVVLTAPERGSAASVLEFIDHNDHFFLNLSMGASKAALDAARNIPGSSIVVALARNGTEFGIQLAGTGGEWFTGPSPIPDALFFTGFAKKDANPDIGDSSITETNGLGGFAIASSPAIVQFVGGSAPDAVRYTLAMYEITSAEHTVYKIPALDFRGTPVGIDVRKVVEGGVLPFIDTGVAHREAGIGQIGAGVLSAPAEPFQKALAALARHIKQTKEK